MAQLQTSEDHNCPKWWQGEGPKEEAVAWEAPQPQASSGEV
jgi:hypothetical protein